VGVIVTNTNIRETASKWLLNSTEPNTNDERSFEYTIKAHKTFTTRVFKLDDV
jgi:hypothetical protein